MKTKTVEEFWQDWLHPSGIEKAEDHLKRLIAEAMDQARRKENEACAMLAKDNDAPDTFRAIRARVAPPKPVWCGHFTWVPPNAWFLERVGYAQETWNQCPICGAKRPEGC